MIQPDFATTHLHAAHLNPAAKKNKRNTSLARTGRISTQKHSAAHDDSEGLQCKDAKTGLPGRSLERLCPVCDRRPAFARLPPSFHFRLRTASPRQAGATSRPGSLRFRCASSQAGLPSRSPKGEDWPANRSSCNERRLVPVVRLELTRRFRPTHLSQSLK